MGYRLEIEEKSAGPLSGGIANHGYQCGMLWGATLAAGAQAYQLCGPGPKAETLAVITAKKLAESLPTCNKSGKTNCRKITGINMQGEKRVVESLKFIFSGRAAGCFSMAGKFAKAAFNDINANLPEPGTEVPATPVSCSAMVAQKTGASGTHTVMAAGLAGGIGLSGGGCGALGTAIWLTAINANNRGTDKKTINARVDKIIEKFLTVSGGRFECAEIVGRKFENTSDHADYLRGGGCREIIESMVNI